MSSLLRRPKLTLLVLSLVFACLSCSTLVGQLIYENNFDQHTSAGLYTQGMLADDWNQPTFNDGVDEGRVTIVTGEQAFGGVGSSLAVFYPAGEVGTEETGAQWKSELGGEYSEAYLSYRVKFSEGFDFVRGGKLPGLAGGTAPTDGTPADGVNGWTGRLMWRTEFQGEPGVPEQLVSAGATCARYTNSGIDQNGEQEDSIYWIGADGNNPPLTSGVWYQITQRVRMNTPGVPDGILQVWLDGELVHFQDDILYRTVSDLQIDQVFFSTFFAGGSGSGTSKDETAFFDDFKVMIPRGDFIKVPEDFVTIQEAIDAALPGDTVLVRDPHIENIVVNKRITLRGFPGTRINGRDPNLPTISIEHEGAVVNGFVVTNGGGVDVLGSRENVALDNLSIILSRASGIRFNDYCNGCSVNRCNINLNASEGIYARNLEGLLIEDSNMIGNNLNGIHLENVVDGFVDDNNTWRNGLHGVFVQGSFGIDVEDNHARDNQLSGFVALNSDVDLEANLSFRNFLDGFLIDSCPGITLSGNSSLFNDQGFAWRNSDFNLILGNESARNDKNGFLFVNGEFNIVTLGYAQRNGQNGHLLESETSLNFLSDSVTIRNTDDGILDLGTGNFLSDNISVGE